MSQSEAAAVPVWQSDKGQRDAETQSEQVLGAKHKAVASCLTTSVIPLFRPLRALPYLIMSPGPNFLGKPPPSSGPFSVVGHLYAKGEAEAQELRAILLTIQKNAISDAEPGCHEVRCWRASVLPLPSTAFSHNRSFCLAVLYPTVQGHSR